MFYQIAIRAVNLLWHFWFKLQIFGRENEPKEGGYILASNHCSAIDPMIVCQGIRRVPIHYMAKAELFEDGKPTFSKPKEVTARVTEILGMDADQWKQVSMLAQGEFVKLLDTDSRERTEILRTLFSTDRFKVIQDRLDEICREKRDVYNGYSRDIDERLGTAQVDEDLTSVTRDAARDILGRAVMAGEAEISAISAERERLEEAHRGAIEAVTRAGRALRTRMRSARRTASRASWVMRKTVMSLFSKSRRHSS